jgi:hypothetical protein
LPPEGSGFGSRILGAFAKSFCHDVNLSYAPGGLRYTLQIHSDQNSCVEPTLVGAMATDAAGSVPENTGDAREPEPLLVDRDAEFAGQRKVVLQIGSSITRARKARARPSQIRKPISGYAARRTLVGDEP